MDPMTVEEESELRDELDEDGNASGNITLSNPTKFKRAAVPEDLAKK